MIFVTVKLTGLLVRDHPNVDRFGQVVDVKELPYGTSISCLARRLRSENPGMELDSCMVVLNNELTNGDRRLRDGDIVAFFAPVAGG